MSGAKVVSPSVEAVRLIEATAHARSWTSYSPAELQRAAHLLEAVWAAGRTCGVEPGDWAVVTSMGHTCLDAVRQTSARVAGVR